MKSIGFEAEKALAIYSIKKNVKYLPKTLDFGKNLQT